MRKTKKIVWQAVYNEIWALVSEPGFGDFQISRNLILDIYFLQNHFGNSGGEISRKIIKVSWIDPGQNGMF